MKKPLAGNGQGLAQGPLAYMLIGVQPGPLAPGRRTVDRTPFYCGTTTGMPIRGQITKQKIARTAISTTLGIQP